MKPNLVLLSLVLGYACCSSAHAALYKPTKESIEQHQTPSWFAEAKVGVFIHYTPNWFEMAIPNRFDADQWIDLFKRAGADYFVFTTKHRDGWCNWPSRISKHSAKAKHGPRDLVGPLVESARKVGMKVGLYYNLMSTYEGVTPAMAGNPQLEPSEDYVLDMMHPLMQELVSAYQPDLVWTDGDWISTSDYWHANEIVAWLYNWAERAGRELCLTDRWGKDIRICQTKETPEKYGDFWTLERRIMKDVVTTHPWESCLTLTEGWKYIEDEQFRVPLNEVIAVMCDVVSKGGKFLINIGPAPDGSIIPADREALFGIGEWLEINGEAIYGTEPLDCAQENGSKNDRDRAKELLLPKGGINNFPNVWKQMLAHNNEQGPVRYTTKGSTIYAIHQGWPGDTLELNDLSIKPGSEIRMLGVKEVLSWKSVGNKISIDLPSDKPCKHAFVLSMEQTKKNERKDK
ncbi:alpha-L-fucosidase [Planctomycetota bacterium]